MPNVTSKAFQDDGYNQMGFYILGFSYFCMGIGSLLAPHALAIMGTNACMVIGCITDSFWVLAQLAPAVRSS